MWRLLFEASGIWHDILTARYGVASTSSILSWRVGCLRSSRTWRRGASLLGSRAADTSNWFRDELSLKTSYGLLTSFLDDIWIGKSPLRLRFHRIFSLYVQTSNSVGEVSRWEGDGTSNGGDPFLFNYELTLFTDFQYVISGFTPLLRVVCGGGVSRVMEFIICLLPTLVSWTVCSPHVFRFLP